MPLSEEELRLLEQMERALAEEDPKFVSTIAGTTIERAAKLRALAAVGVFLVGVCMLMAGAVLPLLPLGVVGFVVMLASAVLGLTAWRGRGTPIPDTAEGFATDPRSAQFQEKFRLVEGGKRGRRPSARKRPKKQGTFMQRMEQRWHQRRDRGGY